MKKAQTLNTKLALCKEKIEQVILEQSKKTLSMIALSEEIFILIIKLSHYISLQFNMEETAFEWELTNYPLMQATVDKLNFVMFVRQWFLCGSKGHIPSMSGYNNVCQTDNSRYLRSLRSIYRKFRGTNI